MDRRELLVAAGMIGVASSGALGKGEGKTEHKRLNSNPHLEGFLRASSECMRTGEVCLSHCMRLLGQGDVSMAECNATVHNMLAVCSATMKVATYQTSSAEMIKKLVQACAEYCQACAASCEKHASHHAECKNCMESCKSCADACNRFAAAA